ncbi:MAG: hypothetical protein L0Y44_04650 [Phycisphaerales bacterium]|nr:hypothetical protein [Phycisphaerales bacterium]MCI0629926.1 hypothetical protein [Phycisphaerales bacterium]MCI0674895.1 hypothetical protein [Phycisphaerales bacterium]
MAQSFDPKDPRDPVEGLSQPYETEPLEVEDDAPRRAASARFIVDSEVGSSAALRDAMDPANQSLADALRLSFRVLQAVILVLVVLFLISGFGNVRDGQSGVRTVFGKIVPTRGQITLSPGPQFSIYPYPIGEFIAFDIENRNVDLGEVFFPLSRGRGYDLMLQQAAVSDNLIPGRDGSLITKDGDLAHLKLAARYVIDQPEQFVKEVNDSESERAADKIVQLALQRAAVQVSAGLTLQELTNPNSVEETRQRLQKSAQQILDDARCGVQLASVQIQRAIAPLAIEKTAGDQQAARIEATEAVERARQFYEETLDRMAGGRYRELLALIEEYEGALDRQDEAASAQKLAAINDIFESPGLTGQVADIIQRARAHQSEVERTLGLQYKRFEGLLPTFRKDPELVVTQHWMNAIAQVLRRPDAEVIYVPDGCAIVRLSLNGSAQIQEIRTKNNIERRRNESDLRNMGMDPTSHYLRGADMSAPGEPGRQLKDSEIGGLKPAGAPR